MTFGPAVDQDHVGVQLVALPRLTVPAADDLADGHVVVVVRAPHLVPPVAVLERSSVDERDLRADGLAALEVGDVDRVMDGDLDPFIKAFLLIRREAR